MNKIKLNSGKILKAVIIFSALFGLLQFSICAAQSEKPLSEIIKEGAPTVGEEAASIEKEEGEKINSRDLISSCNSLPENMWILVFGAYLFLLVFNLTYGIDKEKGTRWFWEALYTILALLAWESFDECRTNTWFPKITIMTFAIIYLYYLYYFNNKLAEKEKDRTLPLDLK